MADVRIKIIEENWVPAPPEIVTGTQFYCLLWNLHRPSTTLESEITDDFLIFFLLLWFVVVASGATVEVVVAIVLVFVVVVYYYFNELFILF